MPQNMWKECKNKKKYSVISFMENKKLQAQFFEASGDLKSNITLIYKLVFIAKKRLIVR